MQCTISGCVSLNINYGTVVVNVKKRGSEQSNNMNSKCGVNGRLGIWWEEKGGKNLVGWDWDSGWPYYEACGS